MVDVRICCACRALADIFPQKSGQVLDIIIESEPSITFVISWVIGTIMDCLEERSVAGMWYAQAMVVVNGIGHVK